MNGYFMLEFTINKCSGLSIVASKNNEKKTKIQIIQTNLKNIILIKVLENYFKNTSNIDDFQSKFIEMSKFFQLNNDEWSKRLNYARCNIMVAYFYSDST